MKNKIYKSFFLLFLMSLSILNGYSQTATCTTPARLAWGGNFVGEFGDGTTITQNRPTLIGTTTDWKQISSGAYHAVAIKTTGTLWAWGSNTDGQLGDGTRASKKTPTQISGATDWKQISSGRFHNLALKTDGTLWTWGMNVDGILGDGTKLDKLIPTEIGSSTDWKEVSCGEFHNLAIKTDGTLWAWGLNFSGELGDGTTVGKLIPTKIGSSTDWKQVSCGIDFSCAVKTDGTIWAWGNNGQGQLGDGTTVNKTIPTKIGSSTNWKQVTCGRVFTIALRTDGTLWSTGYNSVGELGDGTAVSKTSFVKIGNSTDWSQVDAGFINTFAIKTDGSLWAWGDNGAGQLGDGTTQNKRSPQRIGTTTGWSQVSGGLYFTSGLKCNDPVFTLDPTKCYRITNKATGKVLEVKDNSNLDSAQIHQWSLSGNANQLWKIVKLADGKYNIVATKNGKLMDIQDNTPAGFCAEGTIIQQFAADGTGSQKWRIEMQADLSFKIYNSTCNKPLRVEGGSLENGASVGIKNDFGTAAFKWFIDEAPCATPIDPTKCYRIVNKATNKVLEIKDSSSADGTQIYQWAAATNRAQQLWATLPFGNGEYSIRSVVNAKAIDIVDNTAAGFCVEGSIIQLFPYDATNSQKWRLQGQTDGSYKIANVTCNKYLRVENASTANGASVGIKNDFGSDAFKWFLQSVDCSNGQPFSSVTKETFGFEARAAEGRAKLQWITNAGYKTDYFEIERMNANGSFDVLNRQNTDGTSRYSREGGDDMKSYTFTDNDPLDGDNFYRINSISNTKGTPQYSELKKVSFSKNDGINIFPNPADDFINVDLRKYEGQTVALSFYNSVGFLIKKQTIEKVSAAPQRVDMQGFGTGSYLLRVQSEGKREVTRLFNITK